MREKRLEAQCMGLDGEGRGLCQTAQGMVEVPGILPGEKGEILLQGRNSRLGSLEVTSPQRVKPRCPVAGRCGGCQLQHLSYEGQLLWKHQQVKKLLGKYGEVQPVLGMEDPWHYRNKVHSAFALAKGGKVVSGIFEESSHRIVPVDHCFIEDEEADEIIATLCRLMKELHITPYDEKTRRGQLRYALIKRAIATGQVMVVLVTASHIFPAKNKLVAELRKAHPSITTIVMNVNDRYTSMVLGEKEQVLWGKGTILDELCGCKFVISPKSFYQVNPLQTQVLYGKAMEFAGLTGKERVLDAYCGIGTIGLVAAKQAGEVIGVELNRDAVHDASYNARLNKAKNARFYQGDAGHFMEQMYRAKEKVDVVFMDPPRAGSDVRFLASLCRLGPEKVVYISCNPATQARDLAYLTQHGYQVKKIQPVDMFPHSAHVETVVQLVRKTSKHMSI